MINDIKNQAEQRMQKSIESFQSELAKLRTGRAHPSLLEHITIDYYGVDTPLSQVASISVSDSRTLSVSPWEKNLIPVIEKAIMVSELGLNPATSSEIIRVPLPQMTEERRRDLTKIVKSEAENARIAIRNIRRDANNDLKFLLKDKDISEDEDHKGQELIQQVTNQSTDEIETLLQTKEKELMEI